MEAAGETARRDGEHPQQRALVVKALFRDERLIEEPFDEITALCETAGAVVVDAIPQKVDRINAATYLGKGKILEAAARADELDVDLVVTDNDLSPAQERNLEKVFKRTVIDRSQLIMDIFARRASTQQARLQVELAQLRYTFPRLKRMWTHLSRYEGGIGMRGPGETQLETDKRLIEGKILRLRRKLEEIERRQESTFRHRRGEFVIALVGYTNVGKSTLLNRLTGSRELVEDKLFATLDTRTRRWEIDRRRLVLLNDTVGFIRDLPHHLVASFHTTLAETRNADLLFHVVDASAPLAEGQIHSVNEVLREIECGGKPVWYLFNKWDRVSPERQVEARHLADRIPAAAPAFFLSAASGAGLEELQRAVAEHLDRSNRRLSLVIPHPRGELLDYVSRNGKVIAQEFLEDGVHIQVEMSPVSAEKLRARFPEGFPPEIDPAD